MGWWLASPLNGCSFARWAMQKGRIYLSVHFSANQPELGTILNDVLISAAELSYVGLMVFPDVHTERDLVRMVGHLRKSRFFTSKATSDGPHTTVDLEWLNEDGPAASIIGFAPLPSMPLTRRAPFAAIAAYPGGHDNPKRRKRSETVGIGDMQHNIPDAQYDPMFRKTRDLLNEIRSVLADLAPAGGLTFRFSSPQAKRWIG